MEWKTYSKTPVLWYTRKTTSNDETKQDTTYVYTKGGMPLVVSYIEYKEAMERAAKHAQTEALYARELYELKKQLNDVLKATEKAKENAAIVKKKVKFAPEIDDSHFSKKSLSSPKKAKAANGIASTPSSSPKKKRRKSKTPEEKARRKKEAARKKEEAARKKEEARKKKEEHERNVAKEKKVVDALLLEIQACSSSPLLKPITEKDGSENGGTDAAAKATSQMHDVEEAQILLQRLEQAIEAVDVVVPKATGFLFYLKGQSIYRDAENLCERLDAEIEHAHDALVSEEARAEAEAAAAARGMPECLHWTRESRKLVKELQEMVPQSVMYRSSEIKGLKEKHWLFVPDAKDGFVPAKVIGYEMDEYKGEEKWDCQTSSNNQAIVSSNYKILRNDGMPTKKKTKGIRKNRGTKKKSSGDDWANYAYPLFHPKSLAIVPNDLMQAENINPATILYHLKMRFLKDRVYTNIGDILISVNPFHWIKELYTPDVIQYYVDSRLKYDQVNNRSAITAPHVYGIAERAFVALAGKKGIKMNQSIIISGESGAGKTEAAKQCIGYLAAVSMSRSKKSKQKQNAPEGVDKQASFAKSKKKLARSNRSLLMMGYAPGVNSSVVDKIMSASPVLEAFGNARTLRNNNSSRFGKFLVVHFDERHAILGCSNTSYLLERSRVVSQIKGERNFHVFYQLLLGAPEKLQEELNIGEDHDGDDHFQSPEERCQPYHYLNQSGCCTVGGHSDERNNFLELQEALHRLQLDENEIDSLFRIVAGILHFGNISFTPKADRRDDACEIDAKTKTWVGSTSKLLQIDEEEFTMWLTKCQIKAGGSMVIRNMDVEEASVERDAVVKAIYGYMFDWLIERINKAAAVSEEDKEDSKSFIGILDIFGFEIFETNSFEQLCINLANEKLQQHFNRTTFKNEMSLYNDEGVADIVGEVKFQDNQPIIDAIASSKDKHSLFELLDLEGARPGGSSLGFFNKIVKHQTAGFDGRGSKNGKQYCISVRPGSEAFVISHYAGNVEYDSNNFVEKNKDELHEDLKKVMLGSKNEFIKGLFESHKAEKDKHGRLKKVKTIGKRFSSSLNSLSKMLVSTKSHFIRCIKSNNKKKAGIFESKMILDQLQYSGVFDVARIRETGFPFREKHKDFRTMYKCIVSKSYSKEVGLKLNVTEANEIEAMDDTQFCKAFVKEISHVSDVLKEDPVVIGSTMVLYRSDQERELQRLQELIVNKASIDCQRIVRGHLVRRLKREKKLSESGMDAEVLI